MKLHPRSFVLWILILSIFFGLFPLWGWTAEPSHPAFVGWSLSGYRSGVWEKVKGEGTLSCNETGFQITVPPHTVSQWRLVTEPIWIYRFSDLTLKLRAQGVVNDATHPLLLLQPGMYGPLTSATEPIILPFKRPDPVPILLPSAAGYENKVCEWKQRVELPLDQYQIDQIILTVQSGDKEALLEIYEIRFEDPRTGTDTYTATTNISDTSKDLHDNPLLFLKLPQTEVSLSDLDPHNAIHAEAVVCASIPYFLAPSQSVFSTRMFERSAIRVNVEEKCREVFLLLGAYTVGTDEPFHFQPRRVLTQPEQIIVIKNYEDGTQEKSFPYNLNAEQYVVDATSFCSYVVPADPAKRLRNIAVIEQVSHGEIFLAAVTLNPRAVPLRPLPEINWIPSLPLPEKKSTESLPTLTVEKNQLFTLENDYYRLALKMEKGCWVSVLFHKTAGKDLIQQPLPLFSLMIDGEILSPDQLLLNTFTIQGSTLMLQMDVSEESILLPLQVTLQADSSPQCRMSLRIRNAGHTPRSLRLRFPNLRGIRISDSLDQDCYLFPRMQMALGRESIRLQGEHRSEFPLQFFDLFSLSHACGLALHTRDTSSVFKQYLFEKNAQGSNLAVAYGAQEPIQLESGDSLQTPETVLEFHPGDWHVPFHIYRTWCSTWYKPTSQTRDILSSIFLVQRDCPQAGSGLLFNSEKNQYTFPTFIEEFKKYFGGVNLIDLAGWAYSESEGLAGDNGSLSVRGKENLSENIQNTQAAGVRVGVNINGYSVNKRTPVELEHGEAWAIRDNHNEVKTWLGNEELIMCPYVPDWWEYLSSSILKVVKDTQVQAVLLGQIGFAESQFACYASNHGHKPGAHPLPGEYQLLQSIRQKLTQNEKSTALYLDQAPNDVFSQYADAAFNQGMAYAPAYASPTRLNLLRYALPSFKMIERLELGHLPRAFGEERVKWAFFHGEAIWLKGHPLSWISREAREFIKKSYKIFHDYSEVFTSDDVEPFIPTLQSGMLSNRFTSGKKTIVTIYNAGYQTVNGSLVHLKGVAPSQAQDLSDLPHYQAVAASDGVDICGQIDPHEIGCILFLQ